MSYPKLFHAKAQHNLAIDNSRRLHINNDHRKKSEYFKVKWKNSEIYIPGNNSRISKKVKCLCCNVFAEKKPSLLVDIAPIKLETKSTCRNTSTAQNTKFSMRDLVTFTEEVLNGKLHFLCSAILNSSASPTT